MSKEPTVYACSNATCSLGVIGQPGYFSGGITSAQKTMLTGHPEEKMIEGEDFGDGVCPNCGAKGEVLSDG